jgi:uncharacterized protein YlxW (UPF0749 family)
LLIVASVGIGLLVVWQVRSQRASLPTQPAEEWQYVVADLVEANARLREEIAVLERQLEDLEAVEGGGVVDSLVAEVNHLRIANGLVETSGPGVTVHIAGPISVLDLHDLINELRNAGAEGLALNDQRLVAWSAISTNGEQVTVDGVPVAEPYRLQAIGDPRNLEVALARPGGLIELLAQAGRGVLVSIESLENLTLPVYAQPFDFAYSQPVAGR